jgi:hypothetical protein
MPLSDSPLPGEVWLGEAWTAAPVLHLATLNLTVGAWFVPMYEYPVQKELSPESVACLPVMIEPGLFYSITNVAALGLGHQADATADEAVAGLPLQRAAYAPLPYLMPPPPEDDEIKPSADHNDDEFRDDDDSALVSASAADALDQVATGLKRQHGNVSAMSDFIDANVASVSGEVGWLAPVGSYNTRQLSLFLGNETVTISIDGCRFLPHVCCCAQAYVFVIGPGAGVLCSFVASSQAGSAALSPKFLKGIRACMQWPRVLTLCIFFAVVDSRGTFRALASTAHPLLVDARSRRQWTSTQALPPAGLAWLDGNIQVGRSGVVERARKSLTPLIYSCLCVWDYLRQCRDCPTNPSQLFLTHQN